MADRRTTITITAKDDFSGTFAKYVRGVSDADANTKKAAQSSKDFANAIKGVFTLAMVREVGDYVGQVVTLGNEANQTEARFRALSSTMGDYNTIMGDLRDATLGVVGDMHLQQGAMALIQTAGVETSDELERMMNIIALTKKPTEDMSEAINNFTMMLANNSLLRLDSFGISSARVRERILELQDAMEGLDRSAAFRMAVMEEAEKNISKFGDAADVAGTALGRLQTQASNVFEDIAQRAAIGAEAILAFGELALGTSPVLQEAEQRRQDDIDTIRKAIFDELANSTNYNDMPRDFLEKFVTEAAEVAVRSPKLAMDMDLLRQEVFSRLTSEDMAGIPMDRLDPSRMMNWSTQILDQTRSASWNIEVLREQARIAQENVDAEARRAEILEGSTRFMDEQARLAERGYQAIHRQNVEQQQQREMQSGVIGNLGNIYTQAVGMDTQYNAGGYATMGEANNLEILATEAERIVTNMEQLREANSEAFSESQVAAAQGMADQMRAMADAAWDGAEAFKNLTVDDLFGRGQIDDAGSLQGLMDAVIGDLEKMNATADKIKEVQRTFDMMTGRETASGALFEDRLSDVFAGIAMNISDDQAAGMIGNLNAVMKSALIDGIDTNAPEFVAKLESTFADINFDPTQFNVTEFLAEFQPAADATTVMNEQGALFADATTTAADKLKSSTEYAATLQTQFDDLSSKVYKVKIQPEFINVPQLINTLMPGITQAVQGQGGVVPGTSTRASSSGQTSRGLDR